MPTVLARVALLALIGLLALFAVPAAGETTVVDAGPAGIALDREVIPGCQAAAPGAPCLVGHETRGPGVGDDSFVLYQRLRRAEVAADAGTTGARQEVDLEHLSVEHGLVPRTAGVREPAHDAAPAEARAIADVWVDEEGVKTRRPHLDTTNGAVEFGNEDIWFPWEDRHANATHVHAPFTTGRSDSDHWLDYGEFRDACAGAFVAGPATCLFVPFDDALGEVQAATPNVVNGIEADLFGFDFGGGSIQMLALTAPGPAMAPPAVATGRGLGGGRPAAAVDSGPPVVSEDDALASAATPPQPRRTGPAVLGALAQPGLAPPPASAAPMLVAGAATLLVVAWLYHRIAREVALRQGTRRRIYDLIVAEPGARVGTLQQRLGLDYKTVLRHVGVLERTGLVQAHGEGQRRYFASGALPDARARDAAVAAATPATRAVLAYLRAHGATPLPQLRAALGFPASTASVAVARLARAGLVAKRRSAGGIVAEPIGSSALPPPAWTTAVLPSATAASSG